jgi:hypothetical protein
MIYSGCTETALFGLFARKQLTVREITPDAFMGENAPSMFFVASFTMPPEFASELNSRSNLYGAIDELGFGESWLSRFSSEPPRASRFDLWCTDRFFFAQSGQSQGNSLASVEICEERVYDNKMRGDLDYTGFRLSLTLSRWMNSLSQQSNTSPPTDIGRLDRLFMSATMFYRRGNFLWFAIELAS